MEHLTLWEITILGILVLVVLFWLGPGIKPMIEQSRQAKDRDWPGFLLPIIVVVLFVFLLINLV